jgi:prepilin-type N-terminal cleavage/methylation domain-containing protein
MKYTRLTSERPRGFTLIEVLIYIVLVGGLLLTTSAFFSMTIESRIKNQTIAEVNQQGASAMELITQTLRNADSITAPAAGATASSLTVAVPTGSLSPTIVSLSGSALQIKEGAAAAVPLTGDDVQISSLTFKNLTRSGTFGVVQISFVVSHTNQIGRNEYEYQKTFTTSVALR